MSDWPRVKLGDVCEFRRGLTYSKKDEVESSSNVVLRSNNVDLATGKLDFTELKYIDNSFEVPSSKRIIKGSILMCMANGSKSHLGKVGLIDKDYGYAFGGFMGLLVPKSCICSKYLYLVLSANDFKQLVSNLTDGANINNLKFSDMENFLLPLPPLSIQREIVAKLEKELAEADELEANFKQLAETADAEFKAELKETFEALTGNAVKVVDLGEISEISYGYTAKAKSPDMEGLPKYLRITDIQNDSVDWAQVPCCDCNDLAKYQLKEGDIVFARTGATTGKSFLIPNDIPLSVYASYLIRVQLDSNSGILPRYLKFYFDTPTYWDTIQAGMAGAAQGGFNSTKLAALEIPVATLKTQQDVIGRLDTAKAQCEELKAAAAEGAKTAADLRKAVLREAFE